MGLKGRNCPKCGNEYFAPPALSREDNKTDICSACGSWEAVGAYLQYIGASKDELRQMRDQIYLDGRKKEMQYKEHMMNLKMEGVVK
ncbi:hypothetical protein [Evansella halocellulosilytica]|uniref:hypothetical protein n=1 Tax=Evansella halocellulosilytica TaxID=2011013 RepID=UPI000BB99A80|nr:hypothetical protein [Evansella halocellulosilytica]